jgi:CysZ protein
VGMLDGFQDLREGFRVIRRPGLRWFVLLPLLLNSAFFIVIGYWAASVFSGWVEMSATWLPDSLAFLRHFLWLLFAVLAVFVLAYTFVFVATLIGAPFYGLLADEVQKHLTGQASDGVLRLGDLLRLVPRTLWREICKLLNYLPGLLILLLLMLIPVVNVIVPVLWVIFSAWMTAFEFLDFPADANQQSLHDLKRMMRRNRPRAFGFGLATWALTLVPVINLLVLQAAVAGGVRQWLELQRQQRDAFGNLPESASISSLNH